MRTKLPTVLALAACLLTTHAATAQTSPAEPAVKLSLGVAIGPRAAPTFYPLPDEDKKGTGAYIGFGHLPSARFLSGPPVDRVVLSFMREGNGARVAVYAHRGAEDRRESLKVAEYLVGEGQEYTVTQLAAYGVEPIRLSVVRRAEVELTPPRIDNRTKAVEVSEIKIHAERPSFELVLRNTSDKDIRAVEIEEYRGWMRKGPPPMYDWKRTPPIKPGKAWSIMLEFGWNGKATEQGHAVEPPDRVQIRSVLFSDGTYEGDSFFAARAEALREGRRVQLKRVLEMFGELGESPADYTFVQGMALRFELLESIADWPTVNAFAERYRMPVGQELEQLRNQIESGMQLQRGIILGDLNSFLTQPLLAADPVQAQRLLKVLREGYEKLLADI